MFFKILCRLNCLITQASFSRRLTDFFVFCKCQHNDLGHAKVNQKMSKPRFFKPKKGIFWFTLTGPCTLSFLLHNGTYIKSKKSQKRPFPSIQNQDSSNWNKICKILTHRGMVCSCVLNRDIEKLGFSIVKSPWREVLTGLKKAQFV